MGIVEKLSELNVAGAIILSILLIIVVATMGSFVSKNKFEVQGKTILLTGASEGMGKSVAQILASKGANIIIVSRNVRKLELAMEAIKTHASSPAQRFNYISADVSKAGESTRILEQAIAYNNGQAPDVVWCIAGVSKPQLFLDADISSMRQQMDVNYWGCADMAHAVLGEWLSPEKLKLSKERHLIFTSSVVAFYTIAGYSPYSPTKAAVRSLADTLSQELLLYTKDIKVHTVFPGTIDSPGFVEEEKTKPEITKILEKDDPVQTPEVVAKKSIEGLERGEELITVQFLGSAMRANAWGGSVRNNWVVDTLFMWVVSLVWFFVRMDLNGKVASYGKKHGHPSLYSKKT